MITSRLAKAELRQGKTLLTPPLAKEGCGQGIALPELNLRPTGGDHYTFFKNFN